MSRQFYPEENEPNPKNWGICVNSRRQDGRCRHRLSRGRHMCLGRECPEDDE